MNFYKVICNNINYKFNLSLEAAKTILIKILCCGMLD